MLVQFRIYKTGQMISLEITCTSYFSWLLFCPPLGLTGISGDKVEIDPVTSQKASTKFWIRSPSRSILTCSVPVTLQRKKADE